MLRGGATLSGFRAGSTLAVLAAVPPHAAIICKACATADVIPPRKLADIFNTCDVRASPAAGGRHDQIIAVHAAPPTAYENIRERAINHTHIAKKLHLSTDAQDWLTNLPFYHPLNGLRGAQRRRWSRRRFPGQGGGSAGPPQPYERRRAKGLCMPCPF